MRTHNYYRSVKWVFVNLVVSLSLLLPPALPAFAQPAQAPASEGPSPIPDQVTVSGLLYRTRIQVATPARWQRLKDLGVTILDQGTDWALVLVDSDQLEALARLRFEPQSTDELGALVTAHAHAKLWLATSLQPLLRQAAATQSLLAAAETDHAKALASLRAAVRALTPEQKAGMATLSSIDDDADGLTNTQEQWWCTAPNDPDTDDDGRTDGAEIAALKAWANNESNGPPGETPWPDWPPDRPNCPDKDHDSIPNLAERWDLGLNMDLESTDRDRYDDGQELFGVTYCPGSGNACGYGTLPSANHDGIVLFPQMPAWVVPPGNHPFVAAFPILDVSVVPGSWTVERKTIITTQQGVITEATHSYDTSVTQGQASSIADTVTWNNWEEISEALETPFGGIQATYSSLSEAKDGEMPRKLTGFWSRAGKFVLGTARVAGGVVAPLTVCIPSLFAGISSVVGTVPALAICGATAAGGWASVVDGVADWRDAISPDQVQNPQGTTNYNDYTNNYNNYHVERDRFTTVNSSVENNYDANVSVTVNRDFETQGIVNSLDGVSHAINQQGDLMSRGFYDVSRGLGDISRGLGDISDGLGDIYMGLGDISEGLDDISSGLGDISYQISRPRLTETRTNGQSWGGEQTTTHEEYEEHTVTNGKAFTTGENWSTAWAEDSSHAAELWFSYSVQNIGNDYARVICDLSFNVYIGDNPNPAATYFVGSDLPGDGCFHNFQPGEAHAYGFPSSSRIVLTLEQMKAIDLEESIRIVVEDYTLGQDDYYVDDALDAGVIIAIEDGVDDGDEFVDRYVIPTWGTESVQDVLLRYFPASTDIDGNLTALWTPEFDGVSPPVWNEHYLSDIDWWSIYLSQADAGNTPLYELPAQAGTGMLFRFSRDSDRDGYNDRTELRYGTDKDDPTSHPSPEILAGYVVERSDNDVTVMLVLSNSGSFDAYNVQTVMYAPDDTTTILNNTIGGNGRVRAGSQIAVGSLIFIENMDNWQNSTAHPYAAGNYTGDSDRIYTFSVETPGDVGDDSTSMTWDDGAGNSGTIDLGDSYQTPLPIPVANGLEIGFNSGSIESGEQFTVQTLTPRDTFMYTITPGHEEDYTEPVIVVSYNDPQGGRRFATTVELDSLADDLAPYSGQMLKGMRLEIVATPFDPDGDNTTHFIFNNPHPETIQDGYLFTNIVGGGSVSKEITSTLDIRSGPSVHSISWSTTDFDPAYDPTTDYVVMGFWTDRYGNIIDSITRPLITFQDDQVMKAEVPVLEWDVGTVRRPERFDAVSSLIGTSHTEGVTKQSSNYRLLGSTGQPAAGTPMTSTNYNLVSGYWATVQARIQATATAKDMSTIAIESDNDAADRFPTYHFTIANTGLLPLILGVSNIEDDVTITQEPYVALGSGAYTEVGVRLNTNNLGIGSFEKLITIYTNDPTQPEIQLQITGNVELASNLIFVYDYQDEVQPLNKIAHVNSVRDSGDVVRFQHGISGDVSNLHPLFLYAGDGTTELGRGEAIDGTKLRQTPGDSASTDLTLTDSTTNRRDYVVRYGYQADLPGGGGEHIYQVPLSNRNYYTVTLDIVAYNPASNTVNLLLDVGGDGSDEWAFDGDVSTTDGIVHADGLADAINAYLDSQGSEEVVVPIELTSNIQGTYFLTNLRGTPSTDYDLSIPAGISVSDDTPMETESVQLCANVVNNGQGKVSAAVATFFVNDPAVETNVLAGYSVLTDLAAEGGQAEGCVDWDTTGYTGDLTLYVYADFLNQVEENDEANNVVTTTVIVLSRPDLHVPVVELSDSEPVTGQPVTVQATLRNGGQTDADASVLALYDGDPDDGGTLLGEGTPSVGGESQATLDFTWTPTAPGLYRLFAVSDRDDAINEFDEWNNRSWQDVYVGFAGPLLLDSGTAGDVDYTAERGYGYVDEGQADILGDCGAEPYQTYRLDADGRVVYHFDHLLPGHFYHLDVTLYECGQGAGRQEVVKVDDMTVGGPEDLGDGEEHRLSILLDPALYADRTISVAVEAYEGLGALVNEIALHDVDYRYADSGPGNDPQYPTGDLPYGWLDGSSTSASGALPYQTARVDLLDNDVQYQFDELDPLKRYQVHLSFYQSSGNNRVQQVWIDGQPTGTELTIVSGQHYSTTVSAPLTAYQGDGSIVVSAVRTNASVGAMINEIALEEETQIDPATCPDLATPFWTIAYNDVTIAGQAAPPGTVVTAESPRGDVVGCFIVKQDTPGLYGFMPIYGEDPTANPPIPGMRDGELVTFRVNGALAVPDPPLEWHDDKTPHPVDLEAGVTQAQSILLDPNWNLVSFRVEPPTPLVNQVLNSIEGRYDRVLGETGVYVPALPDVYNTLKELHCGEGYYLRLTGVTSVNLLVEGLPCAANTPIPLHQGWNWIGYLPEETLPTTQALQSIEGHYQRVLSLDKVYDPALPEFSTLTEMQSGEGYLIYATDPVTLTYPAGGGGGLGVQLSTRETACADVAPTPYLTLVYGQVNVNGQPASIGTRIDVVTPRGEIAGCFVVEREGEYGLMHVYGADDTAEPPIPGFQESELLDFRVNGIAANASIVLSWQDDKAPHEVDLDATIQSVYLPLVLKSR